MQYDINREAAKISALSSGKTDKYEYLTGETLQKYLLYHQAKLISMNILLVKRCKNICFIIRQN